MAQEINQVGTIRKNIEQNVIFNKRVLGNIYVRDGENVLVEYTNMSSDGNVTEAITIPFDLFNKAEVCLWQAIDEVRQGGSAV